MENKYMNFETWYDKAVKKFALEEYSAKAGWFNCKNEVLKILEKDLNIWMNYTDIHKTLKKIKDL